MPARLGAHAVPADWLWSVARVSGMFTIIWSIMTGLWLIGPPGGQILHSAAWKPMLDFIGNYRWVGAVILIGGLLGVVGLATRWRWVSLTSCLVGVAWSGWVLAFLWWGNLNGDYNMSSLFAVLSGAVFVFRFWLLARSPKQGGGPGVSGW